MIDDPNIDIPSPKDNGSDGSQIAASTNALVPLPPNQELFPIYNQINGLATNNTKAFGNERETALLGAVARQAIKDQSELKEDLKNIRGKLEVSESRAYESEKKCAVLDERLKNQVQGKTFRDLVLMVGTVLVGFSINKLIENELMFDSLLITLSVAFLGLMLIIFTLLANTRGAKS